MRLQAPARDAAPWPDAEGTAVGVREVQFVLLCSLRGLYLLLVTCGAQVSHGVNSGEHQCVLCCLVLVIQWILFLHMILVKRMGSNGLCLLHIKRLVTD